MANIPNSVFTLVRLRGDLKLFDVEHSTKSIAHVIGKIECSTLQSITFHAGCLDLDAGQGGVPDIPPQPFFKNANMRRKEFPPMNIKAHQHANHTPLKPSLHK